MVHQHFMLVPVLSVADNILLGLEPMSGPVFMDREGAHRRIRELGTFFGWEIDPDTTVGSLSVGWQQRVEILKAVYREAKILVLDEPTAVLTPQETQEIFGVLRRLTAEGYSIIFISHKLYEVLEIADRITVIRRGKVVGERVPAATDEEDLAEMMVGREVQLTVDRGDSHPAAVTLAVDGLRAKDDRGREVVHGISLEVRAGEILGIAGVAGNGQDELVEALTGLRAPAGGRVTLEGRDITGASARSLNKLGVAFVPADRHRFGLVLTYPLTDNLVLTDYYRPPYSRGLLRNDDAIRRRAIEAIEQYDIRTPSVDVRAGTLSGGNQQKVIVAREFDGDLRLLVLDQPTRGLDVGSIEFIHRQAIAKRNAGTAILLVSAELDEVLELSDRIGVMYRGRARGPARRTHRVSRAGRAAHGNGRTGRGTAHDRAGSGDMSFARVRAVLTLPLLAILLALIVGAVIMILSSPLVNGSFDAAIPLRAYGALATGALGSFDALVQTVVSAAPLILAGLSVAIGFKAGLFNIGAQGQFLAGAVAAAAAGAALAHASPLVAVPGAVMAGVVAGAVYGFIPGFLKAFTGAHEVVTTIMLNYVALQFVGYLVTGPLRAPGATFARSPGVGAAALPVLLGRNGHLGIVFALVAVPLAWFILYRTTVGFEVRTVGANPDAARYAGISPRWIVISTMTVCGLLAGIAGAGQILGLTGYMPAGYSTNVGFDGITVALLGRAHPIGTLFAGLLLGAMRAGAGLMQIDAGVPVQMIDVLQGVILFFLTAELLVRYVFRVRAAHAEVQELQTVSRSYGSQSAP